ncbi:MAG: hypothetical protein RR769_06065, partial [Anaerovoracaceae bacterium]
ERQMKFEHDYATRMEIAKSEGEAIGEAKGEAKGKAEGEAEKAEMIGKLLKKLTVSEVAEMLEMTEEEVIKAAEGYVK